MLREWLDIIEAEGGWLAFFWDAFVFVAFAVSLLAVVLVVWGAMP